MPHILERIQLEIKIKEQLLDEVEHITSTRSYDTTFRPKNPFVLSLTVMFKYVLH